MLAHENISRRRPAVATASSTHDLVKPSRNVEFLWMIDCCSTSMQLAVHLFSSRSNAARASGCRSLNAIPVSLPLILSSRSRNNHQYEFAENLSGFAWRLPGERIPVQEPNPTGHTEHTREQDTIDQQTGDHGAGNIPPSPAGEHSDSAEAPARPREESLKVTVKRRLEQEGRWAGDGGIEQQRNEMMRLARKQGMSKTEAQQWVYAELDRMYPPTEHSLSSATVADDGKAPLSPQKGLDSGQIQGLSDIPEAWPELPANASLSSEVGWVQANRLRIVEEQTAGPTVVHLDQALSPAPSWAALGWLETSIRSYAKFVDVAAKATASDDGEAAVWRRERMAIEEVRALLEEMRADG